MVEITPSTESIISQANKTELIRALRSVVLVQLWKLPEEELRNTLRLAIHEGFVSNGEVEYRIIQT